MSVRPGPAVAVVTSMTKAIAARLLSSSLAITPLMALVAGCPSPHDEDIARTIAVGGDRVVVTV